MAWLLRLRRARWSNLCVVNLRLAIGFAFLPAALKKLLDEPFTDPANTGPFHDFLHAFHATGWFYQLVGALQLIAAALLCTQRRALLGALVALPILMAITAFCWSTRVYPTAVVATLLWLGTIGLAVWDIDRWRGIFAAAATTTTATTTTTTTATTTATALPPSPLDLRRWQWCGVAVFALYVGTCLARGGIYRPRGVDLGDPAFYVLPAILLAPLVTLVLDVRAHRRASRDAAT